MMHIKKNKWAYVLLAVVMMGCVEEIDLGEDLDFEDALVVEGTITDELKTQVIKISRTFRFEEDGPQREINANVTVVENDNNEIRFYEQEPGVYFSESPFKPQAGLTYQLEITTNNGRSYRSEKTLLTKANVIEALHASAEVNSIGNEILTISVDSYDPDSESYYYRYEYEETYKIVAPDWVTEDFVLSYDSEGNYDPQPSLGTRPFEEEICYHTILSNSIIQTATTNLSEDRVSKFPVRNISIDNPIISHRYSILVRQYIQSLEAHTYYKVLNQLSGSESLFSQIQAGYISSNIRSVNDQDEKVLGFFEISSVSEKRLFVNYSDVFPGRPLPPYFEKCDRFAPVISTGGVGDYPLASAIDAGSIKYLKPNSDQTEFDGPYDVVPRGCGDCTVHGTSEKPDFWED